MFQWIIFVAASLLIITISWKSLGRPRSHGSYRFFAWEAMLAFEKTTALVTSGIYHYIRHPLYSSLFLLTWGIYFKSPSLPGTGIAVFATIFLILTAKADEAECTDFFGIEYVEYRKITKMFLPHVL